MKSFAMLLCAAATATFSSYACGVCGSSAGGQSFGLLPSIKGNFIGVQYQYYGITRDQPSLFQNWPNEQSVTSYSSLQILSRYSVRKNTLLYAFVPYKYNVQRNDTATYTASGIGDISILVSVSILNSVSKIWGHQFSIGPGVKLPSGEYIGITEMDKSGLPNLQPGTGSWDFTINANHTLRHGKYGMNTEAGYIMTTANGSSYKYGNKLSLSSILFQVLETKIADIIPQAGIRYEYALYDYDNYKRKWVNEQSGGYMAFAVIGMQIQYKKLGAKVNYQIPFSQHYSSGYVTAKQRLDAFFFISF